MTRTLALMVLLAAPAAAAETLSLSASIERALRHNPALAVARARLGGLEAERVAAGRVLPSNPVLSADGSRGFGDEGAPDLRYGATLSQQLEIAGQRGLRIDVADERLAAARAQLSALERAVSRDVADAYYDAWLAGQQRALQARILEIAEALERAASQRLAAGDVSELDAGLAAVEVARARAELALAEGRTKAAVAKLLQTIGVPSREPPQLSDEPPDAIVEAPAAGTRFETEAADRETSSAESELALRRRERVPSPTLSLGYEHERLGIHGHLPDGQHATFEHASDQFGVSLSIPLPIWDRRQGEVRAAEAGRELARAERSRVGVEIASEQQSAEAMAEATGRAFAERKRALPIVDRNLALLERAFEAGQIGMVDLLAARERAFAARREYLQARAQYGQALNALARARGALPPGAER